MKTTRWLLLLSAISTAALAGCGQTAREEATAAATSQLCQDQTPSLAAMDDHRQMQVITAEATRLLEVGKTVKTATLVAQLKNNRCRLATSPAKTAAITGEDLYARMKPGVVVLGGLFKCEKCTKWHISAASGFVISSTGACVTNYHVVNNPKNETLVAMTADNRVVCVTEVLAASKTDDVAIVQLDGKEFTPLSLSADARVGAKLRVISHPDGRFYTLTEGIVSRYFTMHQPGGVSRMMAITADYAKGSSGAPVFDERGNVVGLVSSTNGIYYDVKDGRPENLQMVVKQCVPASSVLRLLGR